MIRIGYACIHTQLPRPNRTCRLRNATPERMIELARENLLALERILHWNVEQNITLFRISSETIPFASHPVNEVRWWHVLRLELQRIADLIKKYNVRVSMHPGQFTVLNSKEDRIVRNAIAELEYHARFLGELGVDASHKIMIHLGGIYDDKDMSMKRFAENFMTLSTSVKERLIIENDEKSYSIADVLALAEQIEIPVVFDVFHHECLPSENGRSLNDIIKDVIRTWRHSDGRPKLHYSNQWLGKPVGTHSKSVDVVQFEKFYQTVRKLNLDVMLEVKDKERSVLALYKNIPELNA